MPMVSWAQHRLGHYLVSSCKGREEKTHFLLILFSSSPQPYPHCTCEVSDWVSLFFFFFSFFSFQLSSCCWKGNFQSIQDPKSSVLGINSTKTSHSMEIPLSRKQESWSSNYASNSNQYALFACQATNAEQSWLKCTSWDILTSGTFYVFMKTVSQIQKAV